MLKLNDLRCDHDLKHYEVASVIDVSRSNYTKMETGIVRITADKLIKLAVFYETSIDYILGLTFIEKEYPKTKKHIYKLRLKELKKENNLVGKQIANLLKISQQQYSAIENERFTITDDKLIKLSNFYKVSVDYILGLTDDRNIHKRSPKEHKY